MHVTYIHNYSITKKLKFSMLLPIAFTVLVITSYKNTKQFKEELLKKYSGKPDQKGNAQLLIILMI